MYPFVKRFFDIVSSGCALIILSPVFLIIAVVVKTDSKGPVFFRQKRIGKDKAFFNILKFRTMRTDTPSDMPTHLLS
ncbi:MAG: sugar transferase, partial [Oscillospiraceae bacterium]|nr:sugar transferase [Oscillospiraceae bacterium]